jgi:hypothetical protein
MADRYRMTAAQLANKLLVDEHPDLLRESAAWGDPQAAPGLLLSLVPGVPPAGRTGPGRGGPGRLHQRGVHAQGGPAGRAALPGVLALVLDDKPTQGVKANYLVAFRPPRPPTNPET